MHNHFDWVIIGAGFSGSILAERIAKSLNQSVLVIEQRDHIGGNAYDYRDTNGVLVHKYGPHLFHTNSEKIWDYISGFSEWIEYKHKVNAKFKNYEVPLPINLNSLETLIGDSTYKFLNKVNENFGPISELSVLKLLKSKDNVIKNVGHFIFDEIFKNYSEKQWGVKINQISPATLSRIPIRFNRDNHHFSDKFQYLPKYGYHSLFSEILSNKKIRVELETKFDPQKHLGKIGTIFTGPVDELNNYCIGKLPYRSLKFVHKQTSDLNFQKVAQVNYTDSTPYTRILDYSKLYKNVKNQTTLVYEFPLAHDYENTIPFYPIDSISNKETHQNYVEITNKKYPKMFLTGRLADYKYFNMDQVIAKSLSIFNSVIS